MDTMSIVLNATAQGITPLGEDTTWFRTLSADGQAKALHQLRFFITQTGTAPTRQERQSVGHALSMTARPMTVTANNFDFALAQLAAPPAPDPVAVFGLLMQIFARADGARRAARCAAGCPHWWHHL